MPRAVATLTVACVLSVTTPVLAHQGLPHHQAWELAGEEWAFLPREEDADEAENRAMTCATTLVIVVERQSSRASTPLSGLC